MFDFLFSLLTVDTAGWGASEGPRVVDLSAPEMFFLAKLFLNGKVTELGSPPRTGMNKTFVTLGVFHFCVASRSRTPSQDCFEGMDCPPPTLCGCNDLPQVLFTLRQYIRDGDEEVRGRRARALLRDRLREHWESETCMRDVAWGWGVLCYPHPCAPF